MVKDGAMAATSEQSDDLDWHSFFQEYQVFAKNRDAQKARGINDYSLLASVLSVNDEVRLHSRFLYSLLNPHGSHYQGSLFLEIFLKVVELPFHLNLERVVFFKEKDNMDLYITDGQSHVVIENKLEAKDQERQAEKYIDHLINSRSHETTNILFVYLSKNRLRPSDQSLGDYKLSSCGKHLIKDDNIKVHYKSVHYQKDILKWIEFSKKETANLTNLYNALLEYEKVVKYSLNIYQSDIMRLINFFNEEKTLTKKDKARYLFEIEREFLDLKREWFYGAMTGEFIELIRNYQVELLSDLNCTDLDGKSFTKDKTDECLLKADDKRVPIRQGAFCVISSGEFKDKVSVFLWMAHWNLHVGCAKLEKIDNKYRFVKKTENLYERLKHININGNCLTKFPSPPKLNENLPLNDLEIISWYASPIEEIKQLYDFNSSRQAQFIKAIFNALGVEKKT
jgi:hypothetical protein